MNPKDTPDLEAVAMNIVHQIGDALYEALPSDVAHEHFVTVRQATNDVAIDFAKKLIDNYCQGREKAARKDELEHIAFVDPNTGGRIRTPFLQFRSTIDGLLVDWEGRHRQLSAPTQPGPTNSDNPTNSAGGVAKVGERQPGPGGL